MWRKEREYSPGALIDHPVLSVMMRSMGMDRQSVGLLLEEAAEEHKPRPDPAGEPVNP
jgi:hypothetical protein